MRELAKTQLAQSVLGENGFLKGTSMTQSVNLKPAQLRSSVSQPNQKLLPLTASNLQKIREKEKPAWALTEKQAEEVKEAEENELLSFMQELDYDKYMQDLEVRLLLSNLKERIDQIESNEEEKQKLEEKIRNETKLFTIKTKPKRKPAFFDEKKTRDKENDSSSKAQKQENLIGQASKQEREEENEAESVASQAPSHAGSVASSKTHETIQSLKEKMTMEKDWDKSVSSSFTQMRL